jgi:GWxTD domain-containing protein
MKLRTRWLLSAVLAAAAVTGACRLYNIEKDLAAPYADFLNKVRYIVTSEERKIFLELPDAEKDKFIEDFWKRRDPDPSTEENEFKTEFDDRMTRTNEIFPSEGIPGWLTDRGRIYILFGPPTDRLTNPIGQDSYGRCSETWYYGNFPVIFVDETCTGRFKLLSYDLSPIRELNLTYMHELSIAQANAQKTFTEDKKLFDFKAGLKIESRSEKRLAGIVKIELPYARIWFKSEGKRLVTTFDVTLELRDAKKKAIWEGKTNFEVALLESELEAKSGKIHVFEWPFAIEDADKIALLGQGKDQFILGVANRTGGETLKKALDLK